MPATRAVASTSPLFRVLAATAAVVAASMLTRHLRERAPAPTDLTRPDVAGKGSRAPTRLT